MFEICLCQHAHSLWFSLRFELIPARKWVVTGVLGVRGMRCDAVQQH
jgi:hypothetical protein